MSKYASVIFFYLEMDSTMRNSFELVKNKNRYLLLKLKFILAYSLPNILAYIWNINLKSFQRLPIIINHEKSLHQDSSTLANFVSSTDHNI